MAFAQGEAKDLVDRERELAVVGRAVDRAAAGTGTVVSVEAAPGMGKTSLIAAAAERARENGMLTCSATGSALEQRLAYGVVRQLFERVLAGMDAEARAAALAGAASLASVLFEQGEGDGVRPEPEGLHPSLQWLVSNLGESAPVALLVDDAHLADPESLAALAFVARRAAEMPVLVAVASRPPAGPAPALRAIADSAIASDGAIAPRPLTEAGTGAVAERIVGSGLSAETRAACAEASGGNPQLVRMIAEQMRAEDDVSPAAARRGGGRALSDAAIARLGRLGDEAQRAARAAAVLDREATVARVGKLAGLSHPDRAVDELVTAGILRDELPVAFAHPTLQEAVGFQLLPAERSRLNAEAALLLRGEGAGVEQIAAHLLEAEPAADPDAARDLRDAGAAARRRGSPQAAARLLRRSLEEPPAPGERAAVLEELGRAESRAGEESAVDHLEAALAAAGDPGERARLALQVGRAQSQLGRFRDAIATFEAAREDVAEHDEAKAMELDAAALLAAASIGIPLEEMPDRLTRLREGSSGRTRSERIALGSLASVSSLEGASADETRDLARRALADGAMAETDGDTGPFFLTISALVVTGDYEEAEVEAIRAMDTARRRGSTLAYGMACGVATFLYQRWGRLSDAVAVGENAVEVSGPGAIPFGMPVAPAFLCEAQIDRGELAEAASILAGFEIEQRGPGNPSYDLLFHARGRLRADRGDLPGALADFTRAGDSQEAWGAKNPSLLPWRSSASGVVLKLGDRERAAELADEELERARRFGAPRSIGVALRAAGHAREGEASIGLLREAVGVLAEGPPLELARSQLALGAAMRRAGLGREARDPLRFALHGLTQAGAVPESERAREELVAAGGRPRRPALTGPGSLTPSERRIAALASVGASNRQIAQDLFLSVKTIEMHLRNAYAKLGISGRGELVEALEEPPTSASSP